VIVDAPNGIDRGYVSVSAGRPEMVAAEIRATRFKMLGRAHDAALRKKSRAYLLHVEALSRLTYAGIKRGKVQWIKA
jgi:hypothetical protein